jgi:hypothetical protein
MSVEQELEHWQKLSEVCLNVSSTMFAIIFSIIFGLWSIVGKPSGSFWLGFFVIAVTYFFEAFCSIWVLYISKKEKLQNVKRATQLSVLAMFLMVAEMIIMLVYIQTV